MFRHIAHNATSLTLAAIGSLLCPPEPNPAQAQDNARYAATIPFAFGIDNAIFPAGTYQFTPLSQHMLRLDLVGGRRMAFMLHFPQKMRRGRIWANFDSRNMGTVISCRSSLRRIKVRAGTR